MNWLLIALAIGATATTALATHLLHKLPADVAENIQRDCKQLLVHGAHKFSVHGFRSSLRDWLGNETDTARETAEEVLAHSVGYAVERAYRREPAIEKRRIALQACAEYLSGAYLTETTVPAERQLPASLVATVTKREW